MSTQVIWAAPQTPCPWLKAGSLVRIRADWFRRYGPLGALREGELWRVKHCLASVGHVILPTDAIGAVEYAVVYTNPGTLNQLPVLIGDRLQEAVDLGTVPVMSRVRVLPLSPSLPFPRIAKRYNRALNMSVFAKQKLLWLVSTLGREVLAPIGAVYQLLAPLPYVIRDRSVTQHRLPGDFMLTTTVKSISPCPPPKT